jgi:hypothetical protein
MKTQKGIVVGIYRMPWMSLYVKMGQEYKTVRVLSIGTYNS